MDRKLECELIRRCHQLSINKTTTLSESEAVSDTKRYRCTQRFEQEVERIHKNHPFPVVHSSEVAEANTVLSTQTPLGNLIVSRDEDGRHHVFHNVCRHRGATLVHGKRSNKRIICPYHAWSYTNTGQLVSLPGQKHCFPNLDKRKNGLLRVPSVEKFGFIWVCPEVAEKPEGVLQNYLQSVTSALEWLQPEKLVLFQRQSKIWQANWKIFAEGGIETYHFSYAHRDTIGPAFLNNTAVIDTLGDHLRVVMPTKALDAVAKRPAHQQQLRECSHVLYMLFPSTVLLVQHEHIDWIYFRPIAVDKTEISVASLVPAEKFESHHAHWQRNFEITIKVLEEDFILGEGIQNSMKTGVLPQINYGRNEWALDHLNQQIGRFLQP